MTVVIHHLWYKILYRRYLDLVWDTTLWKLYTAEPSFSIMKGIFSLSLGLLLVVGAWSCSLAPGTKYYSVTQRVVLAPLVIHGTVLNISTPTRINVYYKACVEVIQVMKGRKNLPKIVCFGSFGADYLCKTDVYDGVEYIFFLDDDLKARYEPQSFPQAAVIANPQTLDMGRRGVCDPNTGPPSTCGRSDTDQNYRLFSLL